MNIYGAIGAMVILAYVWALFCSAYGILGWTKIEHYLNGIAPFNPLFFTDNKTVNTLIFTAFKGFV